MRNPCDKGRYPQDENLIFFLIRIYIERGRKLKYHNY